MEDYAKPDTTATPLHGTAGIGATSPGLSTTTTTSGGIGYQLQQLELERIKQGLTSSLWQPVSVML